MGVDNDWPEYCNVIGCTDPYLRPHHHHLKHLAGAGVSIFHCTCGNIDLPGTKPKE